jgi:hypothetical protein
VKTFLQNCKWPDLNKNNDADAIFENFNKTLLRLINSHAPLRKKRVKGTISPWLTADLLLQFKKRDELKKKASKSNDNELWKQYKQARNQCTYLSRSARKKYFTKKFASSTDSSSIWKTYTELMGKTTPPKIENYVLSIDNELSTDTTSISNAFADSFIVKGEDNSSKLQEFWKNVNTTEAPINLHANEIKTAFMKIKKSKYESSTTISSTFLSNCIDELSPCISTMFNRFFFLGQFPNQLKNASITPLYKGKGSRYDPSSFRPISVLPIFSKWIEKILHYKIRDIVTPLIDPNQHGFMKHKSCQSAIISFTQSIYKALDKKKGKLGAIFVDQKMAFNHPDHLQLLHLLQKKFNIQGSLLKILCSYFINRSFNINLNNTNSKLFQLHRGFPQGSIIAPILYNCVFNEVGGALNGLDHVGFADDLVVHCSGTDEGEILDKLLQAMQSLKSWCTSMSLSINFNKTKFMIFHKKQDHLLPRHQHHIQIEDNIIEKVSTFTYLGIILQEYMNFDQHFDHVSSKVSAALGALNIISRLLSLQVFNQLLNSFVLSHIDYGVEVYGCILGTKLQLLQNKIDNTIKSFFYPRLSKLYTKQFWCSKFVDNKSRTKLLNFSRNINMNDLYEKCNILTVLERRDYYTLMSTFKFFHLKQLFPNIINHFVFSNREETSQYLLIPTHNYVLFKNSFIFRSTKLWNSLPRNIRPDFNNLLSKNQFSLLISQTFISERK